MLSDLLPSESLIHIAGREYRVRYSLNAFLCLETEYKPISEILRVGDPGEWDMDCIVYMLHAAMCDMPWNRRAVNRRDWDRVKPDIWQLGRDIMAADLDTLREEIADAVIASFPEKEEGSGNQKQSSADEGHLRAVVVDIMGVPEREFWNGSYRDNQFRADKYFEAKGLKDMPVMIQMTDKDD